MENLQGGILFNIYRKVSLVLSGEIFISLLQKKKL